MHGTSTFDFGQAEIPESLPDRQKENLKNLLRTDPRKQCGMKYKTHYVLFNFVIHVIAHLLQK